MALAHHQTLPLSIGSRTADIDRGMWRIIAALWMLRVDTIQCCEKQEPVVSEGHPNPPPARAYIVFPCATMAEMFLGFCPEDIVEREWELQTHFFTEPMMGRAVLRTTILIPPRWIPTITVALVERIREHWGIDLDERYQRCRRTTQPWSDP